MSPPPFREAREAPFWPLGATVLWEGDGWIPGHDEAGSKPDRFANCTLVVVVAAAAASAAASASATAAAPPGGNDDNEDIWATRGRLHVSRLQPTQPVMSSSWMETPSWLEAFLAPMATKGPKKNARTETREVVVVGAGVSGLVCARTLQDQGKDVVVVERSDGVGGRVRTDKYEGFLLDRGFQVFIESYPKVKDNLDYKALDLQSFWPGALVRADGGFHTVADPFRRPQDSIKGLMAPVGSLADKLRVALLRITTVQRPLADILEGKAEEETTTEAFLTQGLGFGPQMVDRFFRPFYQGIYLAPLSEQSSRMFEFVFKMFAVGGISLPRQGIGALSDQLASKLAPGSVLTSTAVKSVAPGRVVLEDGTIYNAAAVVVATDEPSARLLLGSRLDAKAPVKGRGSTCLYYAIDGPPPLRDPLLILNGEGTDEQRPVNNVVFLSSISRDYAPEGKSLVSVTVVGIPSVKDSELDVRVRRQLAEWFGKEEVEAWKLLRTYRIPYAQPAQTPPNGQSFVKPSAIGEGIFLCGDYRNTATLNGAFESGELAAKAVLSHFAATSKGGGDEVPRAAGGRSTLGDLKAATTSS